MTTAIEYQSMVDPDSMTYVQRITLCCLLNMAQADREPADAAEVRATAKELLETADGQPVSSVSEADIVRALNGLSETELIEQTRPEDRSPVGKGRPRYALSGDVEAVRSALESDEHVGSLVA